MEWKCFLATAAYILTVCDPVLGASTIINVTLVDGETPNEGRVEYLRSDASTWESACGDGLGFQEASVICRQLGYPGANDLFSQWPFGTETSLARHILSCDGDEDSLADCSLLLTSSCSNAGGLICYESGYTGCYPYPASAMSALGDLQTPCENGIQNLTIPKCVSLCHGINDIYTYAGLYRGNVCLCGNASTTISQADRVDDRSCFSTCAGRDLERCGGDTHIALFNITLYQQNTKRTASLSGCAEPTPTQPEGDVTTTVSIQASSSSSSSTPATTTPATTPIATTPPSSSPSSSSSSTTPATTAPATTPISTTPPAITPSSTSSPPSSSPPPPSSSMPPSPSLSPPLSSSPSPSSPPPTSPVVPSTDRTTTEGLTTTAHTVSETNNSTQSTRELATTNIYSTSSTGTSTQSENCTCPPKPECSSSKGVQIGLIVVVVALLLYAVAITFLLIQLRRKVPTRTGENGPDPYMDLQPRPEADRTYQEMAVTSTASSKKPGERRLPSSNLAYENQNVAQYANKIKESADYEDVLTPN